MTNYNFDVNSEFNKDITKPKYRVELDVINYALAVNGASVTASSTLSASFPASSIIDGDRTHRNWGGVVRGDATKYGGWQSNGTGEETLTIDFGATRSINRMEIYFYPKGTRINNAGSGSIPKTFSIYYQTQGSIDWNLWTGLAGVEESTLGVPTYFSEAYHGEFYFGGGCDKADIRNGTVINNASSRVVVADATGLSNVRKVKLVFTEPVTAGTRYRVCEIEIYKTVDISEFVDEISVNRRKDIYFNRYVMAQMNLVLNNADKRFSPKYTPTATEIAAGFFNSEIRPDMRCRVYLGLDRNGLGSVMPAGFFYVCTWKGSSSDKTVSVMCKDRIKHLNNKEIEVENTILAGQYIEYLLEYLALQANVSADELVLDDTYVDTQYFFPNTGTKVWAEMQKLAEAVANISLYINRNGLLEYHSFLDSIPHEWTTRTATEFEACTLNNIATRSFTDKLALPTKKHETLFASPESMQGFVNTGSGIAMQETSFQLQGEITRYATLWWGGTIYQTFGNMAGTRNINKVQLYMRANTGNVWLQVTLRAGARSYVSRQWIGVASSFEGWITCNFARAIVNDGEAYSIEITLYDNSVLSSYIAFGYSQNNPVYGGYAYNSNIPTKLYGLDDDYGDDLAFNVFTAPVLAEFISQEYDTGCLDGKYAWAAFANAFNAAGCAVTFQIATYSAQGTAWGVIPGAQIQTITNGATPTIARNRFVKVRIYVDATGQQGLPSITSYTVNFPLTGSFTSGVHDCGAAPLSWGIFLPSESKPAGTSVTYYTAVSTDGITWDAEQPVTAERSIQSALKRYIMYRIAPATNDGAVTPEIDDVTIYYNTGTGTARHKSTLPFNVRYDDSLFGLEHTVSDEYGGTNELYTRVIVKTSPYFLQTTERIWEAKVPFNLLNGAEQRFDCQLSDPCDVGANMKLFINGYTFTGGTESKVDMDVTFTKNPRLITVIITPKTDVTITSMYIEAQPYRQTGIIQSIAEATDAIKAKYGAREYNYENAYIYVKATADKIAADLLTEFQLPKVTIEDNMPIQFCPGIELEALTRIVELHSGISGIYEVIGYTHKVTRAEAKTLIQAVESVTA